MNTIMVIKKAISDAVRPHDPTKEKRVRSFDEKSVHAVTACTMLYHGLMDGSIVVEEAVVQLRKGWRALGKAVAYPFACHRCKTRDPKGTQNVWVTGERGSPLTYECGNCHGGPRLPGM